jgi:hypothetical protein
MSVTRRQAVTFSVIVPLYDCRDAGTDALRAALAQTFARERYEVIAVVDAGADRAGSDALAARLRIDAIDAVLCTHHNDLGLRWLLRLLAATGRAKARPLRSLGEQRRATTRAASGLPPAARSGRGGRGRMAAAARGAGADPGVDGAGRTLARFRPRRVSRRGGLHGRFGLLRRACVRPSRKVVSHRTRAST